MYVVGLCPTRLKSSLTQFDAVERQTSYSSLDQVLQASQQAEAHGSREAVGPPTFDDAGLKDSVVATCYGRVDGNGYVADDDYTNT
ncbi:hypothetical protein AK812_SmicGene46790, partial [Symbiodinium microadriaticum]